MDSELVNEVSEVSGFTEGMGKVMANVIASIGIESADKDKLIEKLERELAVCRSDRAEWMAAIEQANKDGQQYDALQAELATEKALADELHEDLVHSGISMNPTILKYRKARGL